MEAQKQETKKQKDKKGQLKEDIKGVNGVVASKDAKITELNQSIVNLEEIIK